MPSNKTLLGTALVMLVISLLRTTSGQYNCSTIKNNCSCVPLTRSEFQISCPNIDEPLVSVVTSQGFVHVTCTNITDYAFIPKVSLGETKTVRVQNCDVPDSFEEDILRTLNLTGIENFIFDMCVNPSDCYEEELVVTSKYMRGLENVKQLQMRNNFIRTIESDALKHMTKLEMIDFYSNNLTSVDRIFDYTPLVKRIDLSDNQITNLAEGVFDNTPNLRVLYLNSNKLSKIDGDLFLHTKNITILELSSNRFESLPKNLLHPLVNLTQVSFFINNLSELPEELFRYNQLLTKLRLARNELEILPESVFANLRRLENLDLSSNLLNTLPANLFKDLISLKWLSLEHNLLVTSPDSFTNLRSLEELDLRRNKISSLADFKGLGNLKKLQLGYNRLTGIDKMLPWKNLEELHLQHNDINYIVYDAFYNLRNLRVLNLAVNKLSVLERPEGITAFNHLLVVEELYLGNNSVPVFYGDFVISTKIRKLDLSYNAISSISLTDVKTTSEDALINLEYNQIKTLDFGYWERISQDLESDGSVTTVQLAGNPIECDCHSYNLARYFRKSIEPNLLYRFKLRDTDLKCASPPQYAGLDFTSVDPKELTCSYENCAEKCSCKKRAWDDCFIVDCSKRNLTKAPVIPSGISRMKNMALHLEDNLLTEFPGSGLGLEGVTDLYLQNNRLSRVSWIPPEVKVLDLQGNNLTSLGKEVLSMLNDSTTLTNLSLHNNPWQCDCSASTLYFVVMLRENLIKKVTVENLTCNGTNLNLIHMTNDDLCETNTTMIIVLGSCLFALLITMAFAMALYYKYNQEIKVWLFSHNLLLWFVTEEDLDKDKIYDAFLSYSHKDEEFITNHLLPKLESGRNPYKLCIHVRDWIAGEFITTQITQSVQNSRRTIVVLSPNYPHSAWAKMEFRVAHSEAMNEGRARVIIILYGDVDLNGDLDEELKAYLKTNTYLKWGDPWFWDKLRYALPHRNNLRKKNKKMDNIMVTIDKLDLINSPSTPNVGTPPAVSLDPLLLKGNPLMFKSNNNVDTAPYVESGLIVTYSK